MAWNGRMATLRACAQCGKSFKAWGPRSPVKCCSAKCAYEQRKSKTRSQRPCRFCGTVFWPVRQRTGLARLCSKKCYDAERLQKKWIVVGCTKCGAEIRRKRSQRRFRSYFCSNQCQRSHFSGETHPLFRGDADPNRGRGWKRLSEEVRQRDGYKCRRCGMTQQENGKKLPVDHLVPWRAFENKDDANAMENLASLCNGCHGFKTTTVERAWLRGDVLPFKRFVESLHLPPLKFSECV